MLFPAAKVTMSNGHYIMSKIWFTESKHYPKTMNG